MYKLFVGAFLAASLVACTATGDAEDMGTGTPINNGGHAVNTSSGAHVDGSSSSASESGDSTDLSKFVEMVEIPALIFSRGTVEYKVNAFSIGKYEVRQGLYAEIMGGLPKEDVLGLLYPIFNVSWYDAARFCNALSKRAGLDTAYVYDSVNNSGELVNLSVNYKAAAVRLPTETEWEIAARAGTSTTYYWDTDVASKYAYYAQDKGPVAVGAYTSNALNLYDMAGNVAEWVNDWYDAYPTVSQENYTGPAEGVYKGVRGGGWSDKVAALASGERNKKEPKYRSQTIGFRIVYSAGF